MCRQPGAIPPRPITCLIIPGMITVEESESEPFHLIADNKDLPRDSIVQIEYETNGPTFTGPDEDLIDHLTDVEVEGDVDPGSYIITAKWTFADSSTCSNSADVLVTEV